MRRADIEVPNHAVDMSSWARSACYPRGTFYPLSDTHSTMKCRITSSCFRTCPTCLSRSQAPLCTYTQHLIANQAEGTFERLDRKRTRLNSSHVARSYAALCLERT